MVETQRTIEMLAFKPKMLIDGFVYTASYVDANFVILNSF